MTSDQVDTAEALAEMAADINTARLGFAHVPVTRLQRWAALLRRAEPEGEEPVPVDHEDELSIAFNAGWNANKFGSESLPDAYVSFLRHRKPVPTPESQPSTEVEALANPSPFICPECWIGLCQDCQESVLRFRRWESGVRAPLVKKLDA